MSKVFVFVVVFLQTGWKPMTVEEGLLNSTNAVENNAIAR